jgi:hypothetical protein
VAAVLLGCVIVAVTIGPIFREFGSWTSKFLWPMRGIAVFCAASTLMVSVYQPDGRSFGLAWVFPFTFSESTGIGRYTPVILYGLVVVLLWRALRRAALAWAAYVGVLGALTYALGGFGAMAENLPNGVVLVHLLTSAGSFLLAAAALIALFSRRDSSVSRE